MKNVYMFYINKRKISSNLYDILEWTSADTEVWEKQASQGIILYGWTCDKKLAKDFLSMRSPRKFIQRVLEIDETSNDSIDFERFFRNRKIWCDKLCMRNESSNSDKPYVEIALPLSRFEKTFIDEYYEGSDSEIYDIIDDENRFHVLENVYELVKPRYRKALDQICYLTILDSLKSYVDGELLAMNFMMDEFEIFMNTFGETFIEGEIDIESL